MQIEQIHHIPGDMIEMYSYLEAKIIMFCFFFAKPRDVGIVINNSVYALKVYFSSPTMCEN